MCRKISISTGYVTQLAGDFVTEAYAGDEGDSRLSILSIPHGISVDASGNVYIADLGNNRIRKLIQLTHTPSFAYGEGQFIYPCPGMSLSVNKRLAVADIASAQAETWTIVSSPLHGTLSGFPYTVASSGTGSLVTPAGLAYMPGSGFSGSDSFRVRISDGALSDIVTIYVSVPTVTPDIAPISGPSRVCYGTTISLVDTIAGGIWSVANRNLYQFNITGSIEDVTGALAGTDTVYYTIFQGCSVSAMSVVTVDAMPGTGYITGTNHVNSGAYTTLSDTAAGGTWSSSNSAVSTVSSGGVVYGVVAGVDSIIYTTSNAHCTASTYILFTVTFPSCINSFGSPATEQISIMPNPAHNYFTVSLSSPADEQVLIIITDITGKRIQEMTALTNKPVPVSLNEPAGIYLLSARTSSGIVSSKLVLE
jgi:Secretion system C-terminal sorting domain/NHL repeat